MDSGEQIDRQNLAQNFQDLRSAINSSSVDKMTILADAAEYIRGLKERIEKLNQDIEKLHEFGEEKSSNNKVKIETLEKGFMINVASDKQSKSLLVTLLETFEELGLEILDATISCSPKFSFEALFEMQKEEKPDSLVIKQAVLLAMSKSGEQREV